MRLTPMDIHHKEFRHAVRGYSEEEVDAFLDEVVVEFEQLYKDNMDLKEEINRLKEKMAQYESLEGTLRNTLVMAQKSAEDVKREAQKEAELIIQDSELKAKEIVRDAFEEKDDLQKQITVLSSAEQEFRRNIREIVTNYMEMIQEAEVKADEIASRMAKRGETTEVVEIETKTFEIEDTVVKEEARQPQPEVAHEPSIPPSTSVHQVEKDILNDDSFLFSSSPTTAAVKEETPTKISSFGLDDLLDDEDDLIYRID